jgi:ribosomal protein S18 acetylase RimI-like enzyme
MTSTDTSPGDAVRRATRHDAAAIGQLLHDFNREYDEPAPAPAEIAERMAELMDGGDETIVLLTDGPDGPDGLAVLRLRPSIWSRALECYLAELYVIPARRRAGLGLALMEAAMATARAAGADRIELGTGESDTGARALYERLGFTNREGNGALNLFYEREL